MLLKNQEWDPLPVKHAINIALKHAETATTLEQKAWVIDQMIRALTGCPLVLKEVHTTNGLLQIEMQGESPEYLAITGPDWDRGIPP